MGVTGHRPDKLGWDPRERKRRVLIEATRHVFIVMEPAMILTGMAQGYDQDCARLALELGIPFTAAIPFPGQEESWPRPARRVYEDLLAKAAKKVFVSTDRPLTTLSMLGMMDRRNQWVVDESTHMVAGWDGTLGGTHNCVQYARGRRPLIILNPDLLPGIDPMWPGLGVLLC